MKLEIYRDNMGHRITGYTIFLNDVFIGNTSMERINTPIEDTDKVVINTVLHNMTNNMEEVMTRLATGSTLTHPYKGHGNCVYSSTNDKVLKELDVELKKKELMEDFK